MPRKTRPVEGLTARERAIVRRVRAARMAMDPPLTQEQIASYLGMTKAGYGHYEREAQPYSVEQLFALAELLQQSVTQFLGIDTGLSEADDHLLQAWRAIKDDRIRQLILNMINQATTMS